MFYIFLYSYQKMYFSINLSKFRMEVLFVQITEEARELEKQLRQPTKEKNEAVRGQEFEKVLSSSLSDYL